MRRTDGGIPVNTFKINIIFDAPPGPTSGRFIDVENDEGESINIGQWLQRPDGLWSLSITAVHENKVDYDGINEGSL